MKKNSWKQVRIFVLPDDESSSTYQWSIEVCGNIIKQFIDRYPKTRFWFTKYACSLVVDGELSDGLPSKYINKDGQARSIRFRFKMEDRKKISFLELLIKSYEGLYWSEGVKEYDHFKDLCGERFFEWNPFSKPKASEKSQRGDIVQRLLEYNCRLILDCIKPIPYTQTKNKWFLEKNTEPNNAAFGNVSRSIMHLISNPWVTYRNGMLPVYIVDWSAINYI